jgi:hypothetical protein
MIITVFEEKQPTSYAVKSRAVVCVFPHHGPKSPSSLCQVQTEVEPTSAFSGRSQQSPALLRFFGEPQGGSCDRDASYFPCRLKFAVHAAQSSCVANL